MDDDIEELKASIKAVEKERTALPFLILGFAFFVGWLNGEDIWSGLKASSQEAGLLLGIIFVVSGVWSILLNMLRRELRELNREKSRK